MRGGICLFDVAKVYQSRPLLLLLHHLTLLRMTNNDIFILKTIPKQMLFIDLLLEKREVLGLEVREKLRD